jgi:hypothetical protein
MNAAGPFSTRLLHSPTFFMFHDKTVILGHPLPLSQKFGYPLRLISAVPFESIKYHARTRAQLVPAIAWQRNSNANPSPTGEALSRI